MNNDLSIYLIEKCLTLTNIEQTLIAQNVANANSINYNEKQLNFKASLQSVREKLQHQSLTENDIRHIQAQIEETGSSVALDKQMLQSNKASTRYQMLLALLNAKLSLTASALKGETS